MAYIFKKNNKWAFRIDIGRDPLTGKRKQKSKQGYRTEKEAINAATLMEADLLNDTYVNDTNITFEKYAAEWLEIYKINKKLSTVRIREFTIEHLKKYFKHFKMQEITKRMYQKALLDFSKKYSHRTTILFHSLAKVIFRDAKGFEVIKTDPTEHSKIPQQKISLEEIENNIPKFMEKDELLKFLKTVEEYYSFEDYVAFYLLAFTGLRINELCGLLWDCVDFKENKITIKRNLFSRRAVTSSYELTTPKTKTSIRTIDVYYKAMDLLKLHQKNQNIEKMQHRKTWNKRHDFVFTSKKQKGMPALDRNYYSKMKISLRKAGLQKHFTPHSLRHTHTSLLAAAGRDLYEIMERLGHSNDTITRNIYLHVTQEKRKEVSDSFAKYLGL
ncbi:site-specific integrase [Selenomonadales bacterium OttesenSCG-928-I06]|nr:site-specific integrase [Selenomonadales bacterium OttesenSCG-928-I06]